LNLCIWVKTEFAFVVLTAEAMRHTVLKFAENIRELLFYMNSNER